MLHSSNRVVSAVIPLALGVLLTAIPGFAQSSVCPRFPVGSTITQPHDIFSQNGLLQVDFLYDTAVDQSGNTRFCFKTASGYESPTLHVNPGDRLQISLKNNTPAGTPMAMGTMPGMAISPTNTCGAATMNSSSVNIHYHGTNTPPVCHQDEVILTTVNSGERFLYDVHFPTNEPPGLYWYHPHIHGIAEAAVLGGASGAIVVEGIQNVNHAVAGLPEQVLIVRDNLVPGNPDPGGQIPSWDISVNYIPVPWPKFTPAVLQMRPNERQFWRVLNASADTILDVQLQYDGTPQPLQVVALDGVPTGSQDGTSLGKSYGVTDILIPPAGRAEFIVTGPSTSVKNATFLTLNIDTGPDGDNDPTRPIATVKTSYTAPEPPLAVSDVIGAPPPQLFASLDAATPTTERRLYFSEVLSDPTNPNSPTNFFITVDGATPTLFSPDNPPAIVTTQGSVEDWIIENRAQENHEFHIHQIHFLLLAQNGVAVANQQYYDTFQVPYWSGTGPYPSIKVRMDFRGPVVGDFVYHCHILGHEDGGMMAIIRVNPAQK